MNFRMVHNNINVSELDKSLDFYAKALDLEETRRLEDEDYIIVYLSDHSTAYRLELTWLRKTTGLYNLGDNEFHFAFATDDYSGALKRHTDMGCVVFVNDEMGIYFIEDPDGYWIEILPEGLSE
ncbi:MAG: VOC family protein [Christensenellaceae bacterium]